MGSTRIAPELLLRILEYIDNPMVQAKLCLLDTQTHTLVAPILYSLCKITQLEGIAAFCKAIKGNQYLGRHVMGLIIHCLAPQPKYDGENMAEFMKNFGFGISPEERARNEPQWTEDHVSNLRDALGLLPNLDTLIVTNGSGFASVFDGLQVTFQLKVLGTVHFPGAAFMQFLKNQKAIETLRIETIRHKTGENSDSDSDYDWDWDYGYYDPDNVRVPDSVIEAAADPTFLPKLSLIATEPLKCTALAPGRPVQRVIILQCECVPPLRNDRYRELAVALGKTSAPLVSLEFQRRLAKPYELDSWTFLDILSETSVSERLRALVLHDFEGNFMDLVRQSPFLKMKAQLLKEKFKSIERFEVLRRDLSMGLFPKQPLPDFFRQFYGAMNELSAWQETCPTLKKVVLFDLEIV
ncbi:hypothetical protein BDV93DRAFT_547304 [Ceratobasidium sp. AG-I]|nr:hypothetical protein BDV93DRAFT_547304 [Ceratobasidium sp. AG-I]